MIVANNDAKYQINKLRAKKYARDVGAQLRWSPAKDVASSEALQAQVCNKDCKIKCLGATGHPVPAVQYSLFQCFLSCPKNVNPIKHPTPKSCFKPPCIVPGGCSTTTRTLAT